MAGSRRAVPTEMRKRTTKVQRAHASRVGGPLKTVQDKTRRLYDFSLKLFWLWSSVTGQWPQSNEELDAVATQFLLHCWQEGETRAVVANLLSGISDTEPSLRSHLGGTRRLYQAWIRRELGSRCCPVTLQMAEALAGLMIHWDFFEDAVMILLLHHCLSGPWKASTAEKGT